MLLNQTLKRTVLALVAVAVAISWTSTGQAQSPPCIVGRGLDPLDVVNSGPRHNVWVVLDSSLSMLDRFSSGGPDRKIDVARRVIISLMDTLEDAAGRPLVNWGFAHFDEAKDNPAIPPSLAVPGGGRCFEPAVGGGFVRRIDANDDLDKYSDKPDGCVGLKDTTISPPGRCGLDSRPDIESILNGIVPTGITPIGVAFSDIAEYLRGKHRPDFGTPASTTDYVSGLLPDQKNFIILLTDGQDTCECTSGGYDPNDINNLTPNVAMRPNQANPDPEVSGPGAFPPTPTFVAEPDRAAYNAGLKAEAALQSIDPNIDGSAGNAFVIGMDLTFVDKRRINTIAWMASGAALTDRGVSGRPRAEMSPAFFADNEAGLVQAFEDILSRVSIPASRLALGAATVASVKEVISTHTNPTEVASDIMPGPGSDPLEYRTARQIRSNHRNNVQFATSVEVPGFKGHLTATNIYKVEKADPSDTSPLRPRVDRVADFTAIWDAGVELQDDDPAARPMFFSRRGSNAVMPFNVANVTPADLGVSAGYLSSLDGVGARTDDDARDIVVAVTRGFRLFVDKSPGGTGLIYNAGGGLNLTRFEADGVTPTWKLYENTGGSVAVISEPPRSPDFDPPLNHGTEYGVGGEEPGDGFYWDHINRRTMVYYTSNFGVLHGFDGQFGTEVVAFIADDTLGLDPSETPGSRDTLKDIVEVVVKEANNVVNHQFALSGNPTSDDVFMRSDRGADDEWHTVLVYGRGKGGRFITALDVTTVPTNPTTLKQLWNRGNREGIVEGPIDGCGETWSVPVLGPVNTASVPSPTDVTADQWLVWAGGGYGCDNADFEGQFLFAFRVEDGFIYHRAQMPASDPTAPIPYNAMPARATLFNPHEEDAADNKDFVTRVYIPDMQGRVLKLNTLDLDPANWTFGVFAEMGLEHPITAPVTILNDVLDPSKVFVMAGSGGDRRAPVPATGFKFRIWIDSDPDGSNTFQYAATDPPPFEQIFRINERMWEQAVTIGQVGDVREAVVFFLASEEIFDANVCVVSFTSTLYAAGIASGLSDFDLDTSQPGVDSADLGEGKAFQFARDGNLYVTRSGGLGIDADVSVWGDGEFNDELPAGGLGGFSVQLRIDGFRISPF